MRNIIEILFYIAFAQKCFCERIICVFPTPSFGYQIAYRSLTEELHNRGHELVILTTYPAKYVLPNITQIDLGPASYAISKSYFANMKLTSYKKTYMLDMYYKMMLKVIDEQLKDPAVKMLLENESERFDLLLVEAYTPTWFALAEKFNVPIVSIASTHTTLQNFDSMANPSHPLLYPGIFSSYEDGSRFFQRLNIVYNDMWFKWIYYINYLPKFEDLAAKHFGNNSPPVGLIERKTDVMLVNIHPLLVGVRPTVPGLEFLGNLHMKSTNPLPDWYESFLATSDSGFILFSLGADILSMDLPLEKINILVSAFSELPYNVVWKWENQTLPGHPSNVFIHGWTPQCDLLNHPNIVAFITHGGLRSVEEAIFYRVPMIGMPFGGDQIFNVARLVQLGVAAHLDYETLSKDSIKEAINKVTSNITYNNKVIELSKLMKDEPLPPLQRAVWWVEYVMRHRGAQHLRTSAHQLPLYQFLFLDIIFFFLVTFICFLLCLYFGLKFAKQKIFGSRASLLMYHGENKKSK